MSQRPLILLCTTEPQKSRHAQFLHELHLYLSVLSRNAGQTFAAPEPIELISKPHAEIISMLEKERNRIAGFHFDGIAETYNEFTLQSAKNLGIDFSSYLATLPILNLVFLNYCSAATTIDPITNTAIGGVIVGTSRKNSYGKVRLFTECFYGDYIFAHKPAETAFNHAAQIAGITPETEQPYFAFFWSKNKTRFWRTESDTVDIIGTTPKIIGEETTPKPPSPLDQSATSDNSPGSKKRPRPPRNYTRGTCYVGNRPFTPDDADIFFGRDTEIDALVDFVKDTSKPPFAVLSGPAGSGKTSLIQAGLLPNLDKTFEVIQLSGQSTPDLVAELHARLWQQTGQDDLLLAWQTIEGNFGSRSPLRDRQIVLILDQIDGMINSPQPRVRGELQRFLYALIPIYAHTLFRSQSKVIFSARPLEAKDLRDYLLEVAFPTFVMPLQVISTTGLKEAIEEPFRNPLPSQLSLNDDVAPQILNDLGKEPTSVQLPFLQAMVESLWIEVQRKHGVGAAISLAEYSALYKSCKLFEPFLDTQMQKVLNQLGGRVDPYTLLKILWLHSSPHHLSNQQAMRQRQQLFQHITPTLMAEIVATLCNHYLLIAVPANKPATVQIAHRELSPLVSKRLIELGRSPIVWWQALWIGWKQTVNHLFDGLRSWRKNYNSSPINGGQLGSLSTVWSDTTIIITLLALIGVSILAGFLLTQLIDS